MEREPSMSKKNVIVREASVKDIEGIIRVLKSTRLGEECWDENEHFAAENIRETQRDKGILLLVAESNSLIVGFIDCVFFPSFWESQKQGLIVDFFVHPAEQGKGIGSRLLDALIERAESQGVAELHVSTQQFNLNARKLYNKFGFIGEQLLLERRQDRE